MQDRFVGDVGDFGKLLLLRHLTCATKLRLGVLWYRTPDETHDKSGKHTNLNKFRHLDPVLTDALQTITTSGRRTVEALEAADLLPPETRYHHETLDLAGRRFHERPAIRDEWLKACLSSTADCELVFFDPDNGLRHSSEKCNHAKGWRYVYYEDLERFWARGQSLIVYHHLGRTAGQCHEDQIKAKISEVKSRLTDATDVEPLHFRRGTGRAYLLVIRKHHQSSLVPWARAFRKNHAYEELNRKA